MSATVERPAPSARNVAFAVIRDVFGPQARGAAESLDRHLRAAALEPRDRAFATDLAYGTIERRRWLDFQLEPYLGARAAKLPPMIAEILRMGAFQLRAMRVHDYAAVSESVQLARRFGHTGTAGLVNAVLRRVSVDAERVVDAAEITDPDDALGITHSLPTWLVRMWRLRFGAALLPAILAGVNARSTIALDVDPQRIDRSALIAELATHQIMAQPSAYVESVVVLDGATPIPELEALLAGRAHVHSESAAMPADLLALAPGMSVREVCSGRGNKTLQLLALLGPTGSIHAVDSDARKITRARERFPSDERLTLAVGDARIPESDERRYDRVLVDAPCSGIGIIGRAPEARWRKSPDDGARLAGLQREILAAAAPGVRSGGRLVYAVCSTDEREGPAIVDALLTRDPSFTRAALPARYAEFATPAGDVLVLPGIQGRDGFYIAVLDRA